MDPAEATTNQPYAYATSDPANRTDSNGLDPFDDPTEGPGLAPAAGTPATPASYYYAEAGWTQDANGRWLPPSYAAQSDAEGQGIACQDATAFQGDPQEETARSQLANEIANGHAYAKHVQELQEFPEIDSNQQFAELIDNVMSDPTAEKPLSNGRYAYWQASSGTVVITNPTDPDGGTAFRPTDGYAYYRGLK